MKGLDAAKQMYGDNPATQSETLNSVISLISHVELAKDTTDSDTLCQLIREHKLVWEHCPSQLLASKDVWMALLEHMPIEAMIRNLGKMTSIGLFEEGSEAEGMVNLCFSWFLLHKILMQAFNDRTSIR